MSPPSSGNSSSEIQGSQQVLAQWSRLVILADYKNVTIVNLL